MEMNSLLAKMLEYGASDLYLTTGSSPQWRNDKMVKGREAPLTEDEIRSLMASVATPEEMEVFHRNKELNIAYSDAQGNRYRINFFRQRQNSGMVIRHIKKIIPTFEELRLPKIYQEAIMVKRGLILVSGQSGSGKSTSIAAMLDYLNRTGSGHVITVEDPIEYTHEHKNCIFTQREVGIDTNSWHDALKNALRQRPDVIYIGEIRDTETMVQAINYAETGHLCIATLHATTASQTIERVANFFSDSQKSQCLYSLAHVLKYIFSQRLVTGASGRREIALEVLKNVGLIKPLIIKGAIHEIQELLFKNNDIGMQTFEQSLLKLYDEGRISRGTALDESDHPQNMELELMRRQNKTNSVKRDSNSGGNTTKFSVEL